MRTHSNLVLGEEKVSHGDLLARVERCLDGRLVDDVLEVGARAADRRLGQQVQVDV